MNVRQSRRLGAIAMFTGAAFVVGPALAEGDPRPPPPSPSTATPSGKPATPTPKKKKKKTEQQFYEGYKYAHDLIQEGQYEAGIAAMHALEQDNHPDVANYIGFASRKLGRYDDAKVWYERALAADANHARTWQYYGMWHLEQGNRLKAEDHLQKIQVICGTDCKEFQSLKGALEGTVSY